MTKDDVPSDFFKDTASGIPSLSHIHFTELDIELACSERSSTSSAVASLLKFCRKELRRPLSLLWKPTLDHGYIPPDLLLVLVCPVHKGGRRFTPKHYRPLALTATSLEYLKELSGSPGYPS